jgi:hypothetical protein
MAADITLTTRRPEPPQADFAFEIDFARGVGSGYCEGNEKFEPPNTTAFAAEVVSTDVTATTSSRATVLIDRLSRVDLRNVISSASPSLPEIYRGFIPFLGHFAQTLNQNLASNLVRSLDRRSVVREPLLGIGRRFH